MQPALASPGSLHGCEAGHTSEGGVEVPADWLGDPSSANRLIRQVVRTGYRRALGLDRAHAPDLPRGWDDHHGAGSDVH